MRRHHKQIYIQKTKYKVIGNFNTTPSGTSSISGASSSGVEYDDGTVAIITATIDTDLVLFLGWYEGSTLLSRSSTFQYTVTKNSTLTAKVVNYAFNTKITSTSIYDTVSNIEFMPAKQTLGTTTKPSGLSVGSYSSTNFLGLTLSEVAASKGGSGYISYGLDSTLYKARDLCPVRGTGDFTISVSFKTPSTFTYYKRTGNGSNAVLSTATTGVLTLVTNHNDGWASTPYNTTASSALGSLPASAVYKYPITTYSSTDNYGRWNITVATESGTVANCVKLYINNGTGTATTIYSNTSLSTSTCYNVTVTRKSGVIKIFLNGTSLGLRNGTSGSYSTTGVTPSAVANIAYNRQYMPLHIGTYERFGGGVADGFFISGVWMFNSAIEDSDISQSIAYRY